MRLKKGSWPSVLGRLLGLGRAAVAAFGVAAILAATPAAAQTRPIGPSPASGDAVRLVSEDLHGQSVSINGAIENLSMIGFDDLTSAVDIRRGTWELCSDAAYRGQCEVFGTGWHALPQGLRNRLSSLRPVPDRHAWPPQAGGAESAGDILLFERSNFRGRWLALDRAEHNLARRNFNDMTSAVEIRRGQWQLCRDADFRGDCVVLGPGRHVLARTLRDAVSSVRPATTAGNRPDDGRPGQGAGVVLYDGDGPRARTLRVDKAVSSLSTFSFDNRARWIEVRSGRWELCSDARYRGQCQIFGPGRHRLPPSLAGRLSSLRPR